MGKIFSDLNLNGDAPVRVHPGVGDWGPARTPSVAQRKRTRWRVAYAFLSVAAAVCWFGYSFYKALMGIE